MEYIDGLNLRQAMAPERFTPDQALEMVPGLCSALTYAHQQGVLHRDIKPENILLDAEGKVKIVDFGISKMVGDQGPQPTLTVTGAQLGTPSYMAPEQIERSSNIDHRADIYSLGVVLYELLTDGLPIGRFAPPSESAPVHPDIDEIVFRALEKDRLRRQQTAEEIQAELRHAGNSPRPQPQSTKLSTPWQTIVGFILAVISVPPGLLGGLIAFYVSMERDWNPSPQEALTSSMAWVASVVLITLATIFEWQGFSKAIRNPERYNGARLAFTAMAIWPVILSTGLLFSLALFPTLFIFRPAAPQLIPLIMMGSSIIIAVVEAKLVSRAWKHLIHKLDAKPLSTMELSVSPGIGKQIAIWAGSIMGLIAILLFLLIVVWQISHQREAETALADARAAEQAAIAATEAEMNRIRMEREMNPQVIERPVPRPSHKPSISEPKSPTPPPLEEISDFNTAPLAASLSLSRSTGEGIAKTSSRLSHDNHLLEFIPFIKLDGQTAPTPLQSLSFFLHKENSKHSFSIDKTWRITRGINSPWKLQLSMFETFIGQTEPSLPPIETTLPSQANQVTKWISEPAGKLIAYRATDKTTSMFRIMNLFTGLDQSGKEIAKIQFHIRSTPATRKEQNLPPMIIRPGTHWEDVLEETQAVAAE